MFDLPSGPGVRVDTFGYTGYRTSAAFDSLLAKVIVHSPGANWDDVVQKAARSLREFRIDGVATNIAVPRRRAGASGVFANRIAPASSIPMSLHWSARQMSSAEPLYFRSDRCRRVHGARSQSRRSAPAGSVPVPAPLQGTIVTIEVGEGDLVRPGQQIAVLESMKMEHLVTAPHGGRVTKVAAGDGVTLMQDEAILYLEPAEIDGRCMRPRK